MAEDAGHAPDHQPKAKIFISYSRRDTALVDRLEVALKVHGFEPFIDRQDPVALQDWSKGIAPFENWWNEIKRLIGAADTMVFVISPDSISSKYCQDELAEADKLNKRVAPILCRPVNDAAIPEALGRLQRVSFEDDQHFEASVTRLAAGLETNIDWIRKHGEIAIAAHRWDAVGRPGRHGLLLRSPPLNEWETWLGSRPRGAPEPTKATRAYIAVSRRAQDEEQAAIAQSQTNLLAVMGEVERERGNYNTALRLCVHAVGEAQRRGADSSRAAAKLALVVSQTRLRLQLHGHEAPLSSVAFSPDGSRVVTASKDRTARIWNAATGKEIAVLRGHDDIVSSAAFNPDGSRIVTASYDETANIWDAATGKQIAVLRGHELPVAAATFSPDGARIVTISSPTRYNDDGFFWGDTARLWDAATGEQIAVLRVDDGHVNSAAFSPDGSRVVTTMRLRYDPGSSIENTVSIWDAATGKQITVLSGHDSIVTTAAFGADGSRIVTASYDETAHIWDAATGKHMTVLRGHNSYVYSAAFSFDGLRIVTASKDRTARIWDAATGEQIGVLRTDEGDVDSAAFSPDGSRVITISNYELGGSSSKSTVSIWDAATGREIAVLRGQSVRSAPLSPDGTRIIAALDGSIASIWDATSGRGLAVLRQNHPVFCAAFCPDGLRVVTAPDDVHIWDGATGKELAVLRGHELPLVAAAFSPNGSRIVTISGLRDASGGFDTEIMIWNSATGNVIWVLRGRSYSSNGEVTYAAFSPDGLRVVTASTEACIWDAKTGKAIKTLGGHQHYVNSAAFSPDGLRVVTASTDNTARIWDAATGEQITTLSRHDGFVNFGAFSPDGSRIVTASSDKTACIWDAATGKAIRALNHQHNVNSAAFSPDGSRIVTTPWDETVRIWDAATGEQITVLHGHNGHVDSAIFSPDGSRILTNSGHVWDVQFATMSTKDLLAEVCSRRLGSLTNLSRDEMRVAGYPDEMPEIDVAEGLNPAE